MAPASSFNSVMPAPARQHIPVPQRNQRVILGMSGGVDSSVAAHLLLEQGFRVEGLFMKNWDEDDGTPYCTALEDLADAERVCKTLNIPLHTANFAAEYWDNVFEEFLQDYRALRTPNPDVLCNREIKFKQFVDYAQHLGGDWIATGHYARGTYDNGSFYLRKGIDVGKDQSYFLQAVPVAQLRKCLFPLGGWQKQDIRRIAAQLGLHNHARKDSTGICFIGERRFADFLQRYIDDNAGPMVDENQRLIGEHRGLHQYTIGQRQGLNIGGVRGRSEAPWYAAQKQPASNTLVVTQHPEVLEGRWLRAGEQNWLDQVDLPLSCHAKIRYRQADQACVVHQAADGDLLVKFAVPQRAITPGQFVAFYNGDIMLGGARINTCDTSTKLK
ncbi:MAG: tRNA 2-thiouridine(34) synthase MnmA [bacterium]